MMNIAPTLTKVVVAWMWSCSVGKSMDLERTVRGNKTSRKFGRRCAYWNLGDEASTF